MRRTGSVSISKLRVSPWLRGTTLIDQILSEPLQRKRSLCTSSRPSFLLLFSISVGLCSGFPRRSSLVLPLLSGAGFSAYRLVSNTKSCDEDDDEIGVGVAEELVDKSGVTNGT